MYNALDEAAVLKIILDNYLHNLKKELISLHLVFNQKNNFLNIFKKIDIDNVSQDFKQLNAHIKVIKNLENIIMLIEELLLEHDLDETNNKTKLENIKCKKLVNSILEETAINALENNDPISIKYIDELDGEKVIYYNLIKEHINKLKENDYTRKRVI